MKKYGLRIGDIGVEFSDVVSRDKALKDFTQGSDVKISSTGVRYTDGEGTFSVYERDTKEVLVTCSECTTILSVESCGKREYYKKDYSWAKELTAHDNYICDACKVRLEREKALFDAKKLVAENTD